MAPEEALELLKTDSTRTSELFGEFLENHGHRCLNEVEFPGRSVSSLGLD